MESSGNSRRSFRTRSRSGRRKVSSVSARLQPDFDPRDSLRNVHTTPVNPRDSDEELDPKTMDFATLVEFLHPTFILDYLQKILQFLKSDSAELCFPNIAPYKETFLVKIANDNQRLKCPVFNERCRDLGRQILKVIDENRNIYRWIHMYESGKVTENVLVYKKMFYNEKKTSASISSTTSEFKTPGPPPACPKSLASQLKELDLCTKKDLIPRTRDPTIPTSLKITVLNTTIQFLNEKSRQSLEYPEMSLEQAKYFDSLIGTVDAQTNVGLGFTSLYAPLYKALDGFRAKYNLRTVINETLNNTVRMTLRKMPKQTANDIKQAVKSRPPEPAQPPDRHLSKSQKEFLTREKVVYACSPEFIESSLRRILDFMDDDKKASLEFDKINLEESGFLQMVFKLARHQEYHKLFTEDCVMLLKKISRVERYETQNRKMWKINTAVGRLHWLTRLGHLVFEKVPTGGKKQRNKQISLESLDRARESRDTRSTTATDSIRSRDVSKEKSVPDIAQRLMELSASSDVPSTKQDHSVTERLGLGGVNGARAVNEARGHHSRAISNDRSASERSDSRKRRDRRDKKHSKERRQTTKYGIAFQSAGEQVIDCTSVNEDAGHGQAQGGEAAPARHFGRKKKLMDDLSTPVEIDKAKRMMRQMGWDGGPLGARGEGITEPIMPAIHLEPGAGLGHIKVGSRSTAEFRASLLRTLIAFVTGTNSETAVAFTQPLTRREIRFVRPTIKALNERKTLGLKSEEMDLVKRILEEMLCQPHLLLECSLVDNNREIRFTKTEATSIRLGRKRRKRAALTSSTVPTSSAMAHPSPPPDGADIITKESILDTDLNIENCKPKTYKNLACKVTFLKKINEFLLSPEEKKEYVCDFILNNKQRDYIHLIVTMVNKRDLKYTFGTQDENRVFKEIMRNVNNCCMTVIFNSRKFVLHKRYYQKKFTNSSLGLPLVSKDEKNTIIYENNSVRRATENKECDTSEKSDRNFKHTAIQAETNASNRNDDTACDINDDSDFLTLSERDDVLIIDADDTDLDDLDTDSQSDKSDSQESNEYKDWESDCEDIKDMSDESMLIDMLEKENNTCGVDYNDKDAKYKGTGEEEANVQKASDIENSSKDAAKNDNGRLTPKQTSPPRKLKEHRSDIRNSKCDSEVKEDPNTRLNDDTTTPDKAQSEKTKTVEDIEGDNRSLTPPLNDLKIIAEVTKSSKEESDKIEVLDSSNSNKIQITNIPVDHNNTNIHEEECISIEIDTIHLEFKEENSLTDENCATKVGETNVTGMDLAQFVECCDTHKDRLDTLESENKTLGTNNSDEFVTPNASSEDLNVIEDLYANLDSPVRANDKLDTVEQPEEKIQANLEKVEYPKEVELPKEDTSQDSSITSDLQDMSEEYLTPKDGIEKLNEEDCAESDLDETSNTLQDMDESIEVECSLQDSYIQEKHSIDEDAKKDTISSPFTSLDRGKKHSNILVIDYKIVGGEKSPEFRFYDNLEGYISELCLKKDVKNHKDSQIVSEKNNLKDTSEVKEIDDNLTSTNKRLELEVNNNGRENDISKLTTCVENSNQSISDKICLKTCTTKEKSSNSDQNSGNTPKHGDNPVLKRAISKDSLHIESSPSSSKRSRSDSENSDKLSKRYTPRRVNILANSDADVSVENVKAIQTLISETIDESVIIPLLECNGIQDGGLVYTCYSDQTLIWLKKILKSNDLNFRVIDTEFNEEKNFKLQVKLNSFIQEENEKILSRIELFNTGLNTSEWKVIDRNVTDSFIVLIVKVNEDSYQYISENNFSLFAGVTKAQFSVVWD